MVNCDKSFFFYLPGNETIVRRRIVENVTGFKFKKFPIIYLGVPLYAGRKKKDFFAPYIDRLMKKINEWNHHSISQAGRITLIKSVAEAMQLNLLAAVNPPKSVLEHINNLFARFLWGKNE